MLITEAHAQAAEAIKASERAAETFFEHGILGAVCVVLAIVVAFLFWRLTKSHDRQGELLERVIVAIEASKTAASANAEAARSQQNAITTLTTAVQTLSREFEGETREARHLLANVASATRGIAKRLRATPEDEE